MGQIRRPKQQWIDWLICLCVGVGLEALRRERALRLILGTGGLAWLGKYEKDAKMKRLVTDNKYTSNTNLPKVVFCRAGL